MNVKELIEQLMDQDLGSDVILKKDSEGNGYSPLSKVDGDAVYVPCNSWSGDVLDTKWSAEDAGMEDDEWEAVKQHPRCVVLLPVN